MVKYYLLGALGALWAAAADSILILVLTVSLTLLLIAQDRVN